MDDDLLGAVVMVACVVAIVAALSALFYVLS